MKYCEGLDCAICDENEPCIYKKANELEERIDEDKQLILVYDNDLRRANTKLDRIQEIASDELNLKFDVTGKLKEIKEIIGE